jgi:hypothetical protein
MNKKSVLVVVMVFVFGSADLLGADWAEIDKLAASDGAAYDRFGHSVSVSGDYAIVGAYYDDDKGSDSGSAYIFKYDGTVWYEQAKLTASDGVADDLFGHCVSISGDYAIIGAYLDDDKGDKSGSAYIFKRDGETWYEQDKLTASDGAVDDLFGYSVSISGDYAIVGAWRDDDNGDDSGSAYIFKREGEAWSQQAKLTSSDGVLNDNFGVFVSISGDYAIVAAPYDDDNGISSGSAYIFNREGEVWSEEDKLIASDGDDFDYFGTSVSISNNYAIVGCRLDDDNGISSGSAYIFKRYNTASSWYEQDKLTALDGVAYDYFGASVSISGDYAIVGAYCDDDNGSDSGSAYIFKRDGTVWSEQDKLTASDGAAEDLFGYPVSMSGDYAIIGAWHDDDNGSDSGSAYMFVRCPDSDFTGDCFVDFKDLSSMGDEWLAGIK